MSTTEIKIGDLYDPSFEGLTPKEIRDNLEGIMYEKTEDYYTKKLTTAEVNARRKEFARLSIEIAEKQKELKAFTDLKKAEMKPLQKETATALDEIKNKSVYIKGTLYHVDDQDNGLMLTYDSEGVLVEKRKLTSKEKQLKIRNNGTN